VEVLEAVQTINVALKVRSVAVSQTSQAMGSAVSKQAGGH
jgi:hypothetical protein